jgi:hypothetical protein
MIKIFLLLQLFRKYLTFCGIGIQNAQLFEMSVREFKRNQVSYIGYYIKRKNNYFLLDLIYYFLSRFLPFSQFLLNLAQQIFEEQNNLERLITKILREAGEMTSARQCCLYLLEGCMAVRLITFNHFPASRRSRLPRNLHYVVILIISYVNFIILYVDNIYNASFASN